MTSPARTACLPDGHAQGRPSYCGSPRRAAVWRSAAPNSHRAAARGIRTLSGEKIQWYLAAELRDRIRQRAFGSTSSIDCRASSIRSSRASTRVGICISCRTAHSARRRLRRALSERAGRGTASRFIGTAPGSSTTSRCSIISRSRRGLALAAGPSSMRPSSISPRARAPASSRIPPMARCARAGPLEAKLIEIIEEQRRAEEEQASQEQLVPSSAPFGRRCLRLPAEEYDWFDIRARDRSAQAPMAVPRTDAAQSDRTEASPRRAWGARTPTEDRQRQFFEFPGPLFSVAVSPASSMVRVGTERSCGRCRATARGAASRTIWSSMAARRGPGLARAACTIRR